MPFIALSHVNACAADSCSAGNIPVLPKKMFDQIRSLRTRLVNLTSNRHTPVICR
jgi:hypothetical protein